MNKVHNLNLFQPKRHRTYPNDQIHPDGPQNVFMGRFLFIPVTADTNNQNKTVRQKCKNTHININLKNNKPIYMSTKSNFTTFSEL